MVIGWRLKRRQVGSLGLAKGVILPRKGLSELKKLLESGDDGSVSLGFKENMGLVSKDNVELFMRLIDGDFPDYTKVIPVGNPNIAKLDHEELLQALCGGYRFFRANATRASRWSLPTASCRYRRITRTLAKPWRKSMRIIKARLSRSAFNARYLLDVLAVLGGEGEIEFRVKRRT